MRTIGLIGGMSWESTVTYYQLINEAVHQRLGGLHSAKIVLWSVEFDEIEKCQSSGNWSKSAEILSNAARGLEMAGADVVLICTNTMHKVADEVAQAVNIPLLHIADATADVLASQAISRVGLLGTKYTMQQDFLNQRLTHRGLEVLVPNEADMEMINEVIFKELCVGQIKPESKVKFLEVIDKLKNQGAQGVILGCTEIGLLVKQTDTDMPVFDTTDIHAMAAVRFALAEN